MAGVFDRLPAQEQVAELTPLGPAVPSNGSGCLINACTKGIVITWKRVDENLDLVHHMRACPEPVDLLQRNDVCSTNRIDNPAEIDLAVTAPAELDVVGHDLNHALYVAFIRRSISLYPSYTLQKIFFFHSHV